MQNETKEYVVRGAGPNRFRVEHNTPGEDVAQRVYFVAVYVKAGVPEIRCSCPGARYRKGPCKHCRFVANLIGRPELVGAGEGVNGATAS